MSERMPKVGDTVRVKRLLTSDRMSGLKEDEVLPVMEVYGGWGVYVPAPGAADLSTWRKIIGGVPCWLLAMGPDGFCQWELVPARSAADLAEEVREVGRAWRASTVNLAALEADLREARRQHDALKAKLQALSDALTTHLTEDRP